MNSSHRVNVVRVAEVLPCPNADTLGIVQIGGYQCVVKKDELHAGDMCAYIQPDSIVPQTEPFKFLWADKEFPDGIVPERYRRITVRRFRKAWSEGLLLPLTVFGFFVDTVIGLAYHTSLQGYVKEGDDLAEFLGITHYEEPEPVENIHGIRRSQYQWPPKTLKGWFYWFWHLLGFGGPMAGRPTKGPSYSPPVYDVEAFKNYSNTFTPEDDVIVTEKIHGSNARFTWDGKKMHAGSHYLWKSESSPCIWRRTLKELPWIEEICRKDPGATYYMEVVPTQGGYNYGCKEGEIKVFIFDVLKPDGTYMDKNWMTSPYIDSTKIVPVLYAGKFDLEKIKTLVEGNTTVSGANHLREGVVISSAKERHIFNLGRAQLKLKSMKFLEKERGK
jgi:hypothetical protein